MKMKKVPMRTCVVTKEKYTKKELIRIVRTPEGIVEVDETGKKNIETKVPTLDVVEKITSKILEMKMNNLDSKSAEIKDISYKFQQGSYDIEKKMRRRNLLFKIALGAIGLVGICILIKLIIF